MKFELPQLPYGYDALEPFIDKQTMELHHYKHHQTYVTKLNEALAKHPEMEEKTLDELLMNLNAVPEDIRTAVRNHGGGHANHSIFWTVMGPSKGATNEPTGKNRRGHHDIIRRLRAIQRKVQHGGHGRFRLRLGMARERRSRRVRYHHNAKPRQSPVHESNADLLSRRLGARLLFEISESPSGLYQRLVECRELGRDRKETLIK